MHVKTRMAPSPTGEMHVGSMATLLKNYAYAKKHGGKFILRIEDTDQKREVEGAVDRILQTIKAYGLNWDEGPDVGGPNAPYLQSERLDIYQKATDVLIKNDAAYYCFCSQERLDEVNQKLKEQKKPPMYDRHCRQLTPAEVDIKLKSQNSYVIRLKVPDNQELAFNDLIRGEIKIDSNTLNDQVLLKSDGFPTYHLGVVVDDHMMDITHIIRGEEWISSTPKHILLYEAFGWEKPVFAHVPVFLNPDGKGKMSKRKGDVSAQSFLDRGYLPEAMLNFFMILGWTPQDQREFISLNEYIQEFDPSDLSPSSVAFDIKKLDWLNGIYIRKLSMDQLTDRVKPFLPDQFPVDKLLSILTLISERLVRLDEVDELSSFFYQDIQLDKEALIKKSQPDQVVKQLSQVASVLEQVSDWQTGEIETALRDIQESNDYSKSQFFMMIRLAVTGRTFTPPLFETIEVVGKEETLARLSEARTLLST